MGNIGGQTSADDNMDRWNNHIGRDIGTTTSDPSDIAQKVYDAIQDGTLITDPEHDPRKYPKENLNWWYKAFLAAFGHAGLLFKLWLELNRNGDFYLYAPIVLDLNGDGIKTTAAGDFSGALFDHDKDGICTATGWVSADDGILVVDRNGDGLINHGGELFGDHTTLADGSLAADGYAALGEFDSNGDSKVNASDEHFDQLRVWRDLNQDGISQANELFTLSELGIENLNLANTATNTALGNGNTLLQSGSYETSDGQTHVMGDVGFADNPLFSEYSDTVALTEEQKKAANLKGLGRDLREAAALSPELASILQSYSTAATRAEQLALLDKLVEAWAKTDPKFNQNTEPMLSTHWQQTTASGTALTPTQAAQLDKENISPELQQQLAALAQKINILNAFTGETSNIFYVANAKEAANVLDTINSTDQNLQQDIYLGLLLQTRLRPYVERLDFKIENNQFALDFTGVSAAFNEVFQTNPEKAFVDLSDLIAYQSDLIKPWKDVQSLFITYLNYADQQQVLDQWLANVDITALMAAGYTFGSAADDKITGTQGNDFIYGGLGDDTLNGDIGNDRLVGGVGNDTLDGGKGNDILYNGEGADTYVFRENWGHDTINDRLADAQESNILDFKDCSITELWFSKSNNGTDLLISHIGTDDQITLSNWYSDSRYQQFAITTTDAQHLGAQ